MTPLTRGRRLTSMAGTFVTEPALATILNLEAVKYPGVTIQTSYRPGGRARVRSCSTFFESKGTLHNIPEAFFNMTVVSDLPSDLASAWRTWRETNAVVSGSNVTCPARS